MVGVRGSPHDHAMDAPPIEPPPADSDDPGPTLAGPPPAASPPPRRLVRRSDGRLLGGVAGGVADHLGIDVVLVRLGFVVTALLGGFGLIAYLLGWLLLPLAPPTSPGEPSYGDRKQLLGYALIALGLVAIGGQFGWSFERGGAFWALVLIALGGAVLWLRSRDAAYESAPPASAPPPPTTAPPPTAPTTDRATTDRATTDRADDPRHARTAAGPLAFAPRRPDVERTARPRGRGLGAGRVGRRARRHRSRGRARAGRGRRGPRGERLVRAGAGAHRAWHPARPGRRCLRRDRCPVRRRHRRRETPSPHPGRARARVHTGGRQSVRRPRATWTSRAHVVVSTRSSGSGTST